MPVVLCGRGALDAVSSETRRAEQRRHREQAPREATAESSIGRAGSAGARGGAPRVSVGDRGSERVTKDEKESGRHARENGKGLSFSRARGDGKGGRADDDEDDVADDIEITFFSLFSLRRFFFLFLLSRTNGDVQVPPWPGALAR